MWCQTPGCSNEVVKGRKKCRTCINEIQKLKKYGLDVCDYEKKFKEQGGVCAICGNPETSKNVKNKKIQRLSVDHDHRTGKPRGLLCAACNRAIGLMKEDRERLEAALRYLNQYR